MKEAVLIGLSVLLPNVRDLNKKEADIAQWYRFGQKNARGTRFVPWFCNPEMTRGGSLRHDKSSLALKLMQSSKQVHASVQWPHKMVLVTGAKVRKK